MLAELKGKVVSKLQAGAQHIKLLKELRSELDALVKAIGECKSKSEEDRIISAEIDVLKQRLSDPKLDKSRGREYMVRLIYCEMLGHDVSWAYVKAVQFASEANIHTKKARGKEQEQGCLHFQLLWCFLAMFLALPGLTEGCFTLLQAAYLALTQFFDQNHELVLLLVNTLLSDLKSDNFINGT